MGPYIGGLRLWPYTAGSEDEVMVTKIYTKLIQAYDKAFEKESNK